MKRGSRARKAVIFIILAPAFIALFSFIVMWLWNAILPAAVNANPINFWQAAGLLLLCKILFGGFGGMHHRKKEWRRRMHEKWQSMTPEERVKFRQEWKNRCGPWGGGPFSTKPPEEQSNDPGENK